MTWMSSLNGLNSVPPVSMSLSLHEGMLLCSPLLGFAPFSTALGPCHRWLGGMPLSPAQLIVEAPRAKRVPLF